MKFKLRDETKSDLAIYLINTLPPPSAVYRYALDVNSTVSNHGILINIQYDPSRWKTVPSGTVYRAKYGNHYILNSFLNKWSVEGLYKLLKKQVSMGKFVHYTHESTPPFDLIKENSIVTVFENPTIRLGTDFYHENNHHLRESANLLFRKRLYDTYKRFEHVITGTEYVKNGMIDYGFDGKIEVLPPPISKDFFPINDKKALRRELGLPIDKTLILSVSTAAKRKNLKAVGEVAEALGQNFLLVRVGVPIGRSVNFQGVSGEILNYIYNACDVLLFPTLEEGFGYPLVEAFSVGLPVVSSDIPVIRETARNSALLVNPNSVEELARGVMEAIEMKDELIKKGYERATSYSFDKFSKRQTAYYRSIGATEI